MYVFCFILLLATSSAAQDKSAEWSTKRTIPRWARQEFKNHNLDRDYVITYQLYPSYFRGDFNDDGRRDVAILVQNKNSGKSGIVIFHGKRPQAIYTQYFVLGAGKALGGANADFKWVTSWSLIVERKATVIFGNRKLPTLHGDAIKMAQQEEKTGLIYWDGKKYQWFDLKK